MVSTPTKRRRLAAREGLALAAILLAPLGAAAQTLVGVTGDGAVQDPASLFTIDTADASTAFLMALGSGGDAGETIAFNPDDGLLYHSSGLSAPLWESIDASVPDVVSSGPFTSDGTVGENRAMVHDPLNGRFLVADSNQQLIDTTLAGVGSVIGSTPESLKGLAFSGGDLWAAAQLGPELYEVDPADGSVLSTTIMTFGGAGLAGSNGLATHPVTDELWLLFRLDGSTDRFLGVVDPSSGAVTSVGGTGAKFAGIAFLPEPAGGWGLAAGLAALGAFSKREKSMGRRPPAPGEES